MTKKKNLGFTLIELTVVIAMTGMIATVMIANFRNGEKLKRVQIAADAEVNLLREGQEYALSGRQIPSTLGAYGTLPRCPSDNSPDHYLFSMNEVVLSFGLYAYDHCGAVMLIDSYMFPPQVRVRPGSIKVTKCTPSCSTSATVPMDLKFQPPFSKLLVDTTNGFGGPTAFEEFSKVEAVIESIDGTRARTLVIDGISGKIGIEPLAGQ